VTSRASEPLRRAVLMLRHRGEEAAADRIEKARAIIDATE
jgi:hypothetical protein